jgi:putative DNA primase/helicase
VPRYLANYLAEYLGPTYFTMDKFWHYEGGVYRKMEMGEVSHVAAVAMHDTARPNQYGAAVDLLAKLVYRRAQDWPMSETLINCKSGMIDPDKGELLPHSPDYLSRVQVPCEYNWDFLEEIAPWMQFLEEVQPGPENQDCIDMLQKYAGYVLLPDNRFEKVLFLRGEGGNGKGTFINLICDVVGQQNVSALSLHDLAERFNTYRLVTSILNVSTEVNPKKTVETETLKQAVSGDILKGEEKFGGQFEFRPRTKFIFSLNRRPVMQDVGYALERRIIVVPFGVRFEGMKKDTSLRQKLTEGHRRDAVFMWMLLGLERIMKNGFEIAGQGSVRDATSSFMQGLNPALIFVAEVCDRGEQFTCEAMQIYRKYQAWCKATTHNALSQHNFSDALESLKGVTKYKDSKTRRSMFKGIRTNPDEEFGNE